MESVTNREPAWMHVARHELGVAASPGVADNPAVQKYFEAVVGDGIHTHDDVKWCSAFVNWCLEQVHIEGTRNAAAASWLDWGRRAPGPSTGAITVLRFQQGGGSYFNHVGFCVDAGAQMVKILGGNQGMNGQHVVCEKEYQALHVVGYRMP